MAKITKLIKTCFAAGCIVFLSSCEDSDNTVLIAHLKSLNEQALTAFQKQDYSKAATLAEESIDIINENRGAENLNPKIAESVAALSMQATSIRNDALRERAYQTNLENNASWKI